MFYRSIALCALLLVCAGCSQDALLQKIGTAADRERALKFIELMRHGDFTEIEARMDSQYKTSELPAIMKQMSESMPKGEPLSRKLVGANLESHNDERSINLTYQYGFAGNKWFLANCAVREAAGSFTLVGMEVRPMQASIDTMQTFTLAGKSAFQYTVLAASILFVLASLVAFIAAILDKTLTRKWLWIVSILFGVTSLTVNWDTGQWSFQLLHLQLFSASAVSGPYGGWVISVGLPVGTLIYIFRRLMNHRPAPVSNNV